MWIEFVFNVTVTTEDGYFVLNGGPDPPIEKDTSYRRWGVGLGKILTGLPLSRIYSFQCRSAFIHGRPIEQLLSPCYRTCVLGTRAILSISVRCGLLLQEE